MRFTVVDVEMAYSGSSDMPLDYTPNRRHSQLECFHYILKVGIVSYHDDDKKKDCLG